MNRFLNYEFDRVEQRRNVRTRRQERAVMHTNFTNPVFNLATVRQLELQAEAERRRRLRECRATRTDGVTVGLVAALRRTVGTALVRTGERLKGAERATARPAAGDVSVAGADLRLVR